MQIYVAFWSLRKTIKARNLSLTQLPGFIIESGFQGIELSDRDLQADTEPATLNFFKQAREFDCGVILDINCDLTLDQPEQLQAEIDYIIHWLIKSSEYGIPILRITLGGQTVSVQKLLRKPSSKPKKDTGSGKSRWIKAIMLLPIVRIISHKMRTWLPVSHRGVTEKIDLAISTLQPVVIHAETQGVRLAIENHWGISSLPKWINHVVGKINSPWLGVCVDFGNFPGKISNCDGVSQLMPNAVHVQAKSWKFNANGEEKSLDYSCLIQAVQSSGYDGPITIEYEGSGDDLKDCLLTKALIKRYWV